MRKRKKASRFDFEKFEDRLCLTVGVMVTDAGTLVVNGMADGPVEIIATGETAFQVTDNGIVVADVEGVEKNIVVRIDGRDAGVPTDDSVSIDLADNSVDNVFASLGHGTNQFNISGDQSIDRMIFHGGDGDDTVNINVDTEFVALALTRAGDDTVNMLADANRVRIRTGDGNDSVTLGGGTTAESIGLRLGDGDNTVHSNATVSRMLAIRGGDGADQIGLGEESAVGRRLSVAMGHGDNQLGLAGSVEGNTFVRAGAGNDTLAFGASSSIGRSAGIVLGSGYNQFGINGQIGGNLFMAGGLGNDTVRIGESAQVSGSVGVLLGAGENTFGHFGAIEGNLFVVSKNSNDQFVVSGTVGGIIRLGPGEQGDRGDDG